jgi:hypothetical protein
MRGLILMPALGLFLMGATVSQNLQISVTPAPPTGSALPSGVTLSPIDGEILTGPDNLTTTTNTHDYYHNNGFTNAASSTFNSKYNNGGWDDPTFFPICDDFAFYPQNSTSAFLILGMNCALRIGSNVNQATLRSAGIYAIPDYGGRDVGSNVGAETVGWHIEEPSSWSDVTSNIGSMPSGYNSGHFRKPSLTWAAFAYGPPSGTPGGTMQSFMSNAISSADGNVHLNIPSDDIYWFASGGNYTNCNVPFEGQQIYGGGSTFSPNCTDGVKQLAQLSADQATRGDHYGDIVDLERAWLTTSGAPIAGPYIENQDGLVGTGGRNILAAEIKWATWSSITHGARMLLFFGNTPGGVSPTCGGGDNTFGFCRGVLSGDTVSRNDQVCADNWFISSIAPIINSPFALGYASVSPVGYVFPTQHLSLINGIDIMAKWYTDGPYTSAAHTCGAITNPSGTFDTGFYIFATLRGSKTQSSVNATFTLAGSPTKSNVPVVGENRTVDITGGQFTDTFGYPGSTVHIYGPILYP